MEASAAPTEYICRLPQDGRASQVYLHALIENNPTAVVVLNSKHRFQMCNNAFTRLFQYSPSEFELWGIDTLIAGAGFLEEAREATHAVLQGEQVRLLSKRRRKDGLLIDVEIRGVPLMLDGRVQGVYGLYQDVTDRTQLAGAMRALEALSEGRNSHATADAPPSHGMSNSGRLPDGPYRMVTMTQRETEILKLLASGLSSKEIAVELSIGTRTVETHRLNLYRKLQLRNIADLVLYSIRAGLIPLHAN